MNIDEKYIIDIRRELHQYPETGFDLEKTVALVKRELDKIGIAYTEKYGKSSIVATINPENEKYTVALRADMDALPIEENTDLEYKSKNPGKMHACGHDAHTAILLGAAKELFTLRDNLKCRVKLIFQSSEEGPESGAELLVADGVMDDVDIIIGLHVDGWSECGKVGVCKGNSMASQRSFNIKFYGETAHATLPQSGKDALAAAVGTYVNIHTMLTREIDPFEQYVCAVGKLHSGETQNVVPDYAEMLGTIRTFNMDVDKFIIDRIEKIANHTADEYGVKVSVTSLQNMFNLYNDPDLCDRFIESASKIVGSDNITDITPKLSSEDFSQYLTKKPGFLFRLGTRNEEKGITSLPHNSDFQIDEDSLEIGKNVLARFVIDISYSLE